RVIAKPSGYLLAPRGEERIGDVSNVVFCNGAVRNDQGRIYLYYGSSDTRLHVAETTEERLMDYVFHNPPEAFRSADAVRQRLNLIQNNSKRSDHQ
ncbi:MAG TPA: glycosidase, partial [Candidatus Izemoplasmatales bacterium]|nr:glycosidase [Candidatus Izemoplasmatales bacterium]